MNTPSLTKTGNSSSTVFMPNGTTLYYSYATVIAFRTNIGQRFVCENIWGVTTGKHLNAIDGGDKTNRLPRAEFVKMLAEL